MPYNTNTDLPDSVRNHLPAAAQSIYREAFNHAWQSYENPAKRRDDSSREATAHRVAWSAVEKKYTKSASGEWVEQR